MQTIFYWPDLTRTAKSSHMKTLILGLGNTILTDDGVGIYISRKLNELLSTRQRFLDKSDTITIEEASVGGFNFIDMLAGFDRAVIVDAIHSKDGVPGEFYEVNTDSLKASARLSSLHGIDIATACDMAKKMDVKFPKEIKIYVMEVEDEFSFGEKCTPVVEASIPKISEEIISSLEKYEWI